jgi:hypothetical protein
MRHQRNALLRRQRRARLFHGASHFLLLWISPI